jgi:hypothetical protein
MVIFWAIGPRVLSTIFKQISFPTQIPRDSVTVLLPEFRNFNIRVGNQIFCERPQINYPLQMLNVTAANTKDGIQFSESAWNADQSP